LPRGTKINNQQSTINNQQSTINNQQSTINSPQSKSPPAILLPFLAATTQSSQIMSSIMNQPQPPEPRILHDVTDPASVIREAEVPYGSINPDELTTATRQFLHQLNEKNIPHLLVGAMAMLQHIDGRPTRDIDLIIALDDLAKLPDFKLEESNEWFATGTVGPVRVDLLFTQNPFFAEVLANHSETKLLLDTPIQCASPRGLVLLKLFALPSLYRQSNVRRAAIYETDILQLLILQPLETESLLAQLQPHMTSSDINALREILSEIQQRIRNRNRF